MMIHKEDTSKGDATKEDPNKGENIYKADYEQGVVYDVPRD